MSESKAEGEKTEKPAPAMKKQSTLNLKFLTHGTLESKDLDFTRNFYEEFMRVVFISLAKISLWIRLGGNNIYAVVQVMEGKKSEMTFLNHNGVDVETEDDVDEGHRLVVSDVEKWKLHKISKPAVQHGTYSFYFWDCDDNAWEILANPPGGYSWMFERGDQEGLGHMSRKFERPESTRRRPKAEG